MTRKERFAAMVESRNRKVLEAAIALAQERGYDKITRSGVATTAGVAVGCVNGAFGTMDGLKAEVMRQAVAGEMLDIVAQGLADGNDIARNADPLLKERARATLT